VRNDQSWFALVTFVATTALAVALEMGVFFASASVVFAVAHTVRPLIANAAKANLEAVYEPGQQGAPPASAQTFTGLITDDHCGARHDMGSNKSPSECAKTCVRNGAKYALVDGDKTYNLEGNAEELGRLSGRRVTLLGSLEGDTIQVSSIADSQ
jgi:hypothetical protein